MEGLETYWASQTEGKHFCASLHSTKDVLPKHFCFTRSILTTPYLDIASFLRAAPFTSIFDKFMELAHTSSQRFFVINISKLALKLREVQKRPLRLVHFISSIDTQLGRLSMLVLAQAKLLDHAAQKLNKLINGVKLFYI